MALPTWKASKGPFEWTFTERTLDKTKASWYVQIKDKNPSSTFDAVAFGVEWWEAGVQGAQHSVLKRNKYMYGGQTRQWSLGMGDLIPGTEYNVRLAITHVSTKPEGSQTTLMNKILLEEYTSFKTEGVRPTDAVSKTGPHETLGAKETNGDVFDTGTASEDLISSYTTSVVCGPGEIISADGKACNKVDMDDPKAPVVSGASWISRNIKDPAKELQAELTDRKVLNVPLLGIVIVVGLVIGGLTAAATLMKGNGNGKKKNNKARNRGYAY
jgi:hypothetical protein